MSRSAVGVELSSLSEGWKDNMTELFNKQSVLDKLEQLEKSNNLPSEVSCYYDEALEAVEVWINSPVSSNGPIKDNDICVHCESEDPGQILLSEDDPGTTCPKCIKEIFSLLISQVAAYQYASAEFAGTNSSVSIIEQAALFRKHRLVFQELQMEHTG